MSVGPTELAKSLVRWVTGALAIKREGRRCILTDLISRRYTEMAAVHTAFHMMLFKVETDLVRIERSAAARKCIKRDLEALIEYIDSLEIERARGKVHRIEIFHTLSSISAGGCAPFAGVIAPLTDDEWALVRQFAGSVCRYFSDSNAYSHEVGNVLNYTRGRLDTWLHVKKASAQDIAWARRDVAAAAARMTLKWCSISRDFVAIENTLKFGLDIEIAALRALPPPSAERPIKVVSYTSNTR